MTKITIKGEDYIIKGMLDEDEAETEDVNDACVLVLQRPSDIKPAGEQQRYMALRFEKGSLRKYGLS
jgi:hypothetical protein